MAQRQQAIAILIRFDPDYFVDIDNAIGNRFTQAAVERGELTPWRAEGR